MWADESFSFGSVDDTVRLSVLQWIHRYKWAALIGFSGNEGEENEEETIKFGKGNWDGPLEEKNGKMDIMKMHCIHIQNFQKKQKK